MNILNSTITGNTAEFAGGIYSDGSAQVTLIDFSTITNNTGVEEGGGIYQDTTAGGLTLISNSIACDNISPLRQI